MSKGLSMQEAIRNAAKIKSSSPEAPTLPVGNVKVNTQPLPKTVPVEKQSVVDMTDDVSATGTSSVVATTAPTPILTLAQLEKLYILDMLKKTDNNKTKTAELLGVSLKTIYNKLASYGAEGNV